MIQTITVEGDRVRLIALPAYSRKAVEAWYRFTASDSVFGLDVESTAFEGLGTYDPKIQMRLIQFGNRGEAWALDPHHPKWRKLIASFLADEGKRFVSHNAAFDTTRVRYEFGIHLGDRSIDTLPMAALLWPGRTAPKDLKALCNEWVDRQLSDADLELHALFVDKFYAQKERKTPLLPKSFVVGESTCRRPKPKGGEKCVNVSSSRSRVGYCEEHYLARGKSVTKVAETWGWANIALDDPTYLQYAGMDALYVRRLLDKLAKMLAAKKMNRISKTEQRVKRFMTDLSFRGMRVDAEWTREVLDESERDFSAALLAVQIATKGVKARSSHLKGWLAERGVRTKSLDKKHLPALIEKYGDREDVGPVLHQLETVSNLSNLVNNLRTIYMHATEGDGYVHPNINTQQAHTGRMSVTAPAMQTFAKVGEKGKRLRGCFIAREGHVFIGADYDSQEIRLGAALSRDPALLRIVLEGLNQHELTAASIFPEVWIDKAHNKPEYAQAKVLDFAQQYGAMPKKIAATLGCSVAEATTLWNKWRKTYAGLVKWSAQQARKREVVNPFGRVIPRDPFRDYANGNYLIQSSGRDVLGAAMCRLADAGWADYFWLPIHDELVLEVPEELADDGIAALTEHMTTEVRGIVIPAQGELVGTRWKGLG